MVLKKSTFITRSCILNCFLGDIGRKCAVGAIPGIYMPKKKLFSFKSDTSWNYEGAGFGSKQQMMK